MKTNKRNASEVRERAVRLDFGHQGDYASRWEAIGLIATEMGCTAETLSRWVRQSEIDQGKRGGISTSERERLKERARENRELKRANEILRTASAFFAQAALDR